MTNEEIELVARRICEELGFKPEEIVKCGWETCRTDFEMEGVHAIPDILLNEPRWCLYRRQAARAIATKRALEALP